MRVMKQEYGLELNGEEPTGRLSSSAEPALTSRQNGVASVEPSYLLQEIESLRTRLSKLSEASLRVSETLDVNTVLKEVIDNARDLTDARYGALLTYEQSGGIQDFITSGLSAAEIERLNTLPQGLGLLGYMNDIWEPQRLPDISGHPSSVGFPENHPPMKTFLGMPIRHRGEHVGNIYLTEKEDGRDFTSEDQDVLVMFASQAGAAIFNARRYREEQQAKADLEALVNISPVGVLVFDAETGDLVSANDETRRIVGKLHAPGRSLSELLEVMSLRRPDGSEIPVDQLPTTKALKQGETILAEEVVIHLQDGRTVTTLVNARPIRRDGGDIASVVATIQDITPLGEMKRQRAEFLGNVSHQLRTPLTTIKGSASTLLNSTYPLDPAETRQFLRVIDEQSEHMRRLINDLVDVTRLEAGILTVNPEPTELADILDEAREAYLLDGKGSNSAEVDLSPSLPRVMADRRRVLQVLANLLSCVSRHSYKSSTVKISASRQDLHVAITVDNLNAGEAGPGPLDDFARRTGTVPEVAGRKNGTDDLTIAICEGIVEAHGGRLSADGGDGGRGTGFTFTIPAVDEAEHLAGSPSAWSASGRHADQEQVRILAVSDSGETARYLRNTLTQAGFTIVITDDPDDVERVIDAEKPRVILLELTQSWADGLEMLVRVGSISDAPVIVMAGHGWDQHIGRAFELGAFDYVAKPFTSTEILARIGIALRGRPAAGKDETPGHYQSGELSIDYVEREVMVSGRPIHLTATEYKLLTELSTSAGRALTHKQLLRRVWGPLYTSDSRIVRTYVKELRHKLGDNASRPTYIFNEHGVGYRMPKPSNDRRLRRDAS